MTRAAIVGCIRFALALTCLVGLVARYQWGLGSATFRAGNFFGYLTIQSNMAFCAIGVVAGITALRHRRDPQWLTDVRATVLACTVSSGVIFAFLVQQSAARGFAITVSWSDQLLHFWLPAFALLEWVIAPGRGRAHWRAIPFAVGFTVLWGVFTLIRGAIVGWYPYFFLDPNQVSGLGELALLSGIALVFFAAIGAAVVSLTLRAPLVELVLGARR